MAVVKYHDGSNWVPITDGQQKIKYYNGTSWVVPQKVKYYSGGWKTAFTNDISGPTGGGVYAAIWSNTFGGFTVSYSAASDPSGIASFKLYYSKNNSSWTEVADLNTSGSSYNHTVPTADRQSYTTAYYKTIIIDTLGNSTTTTTRSYTTKPYGTFTGDPSSTSEGSGWQTWETGGTASWRTGLGDLYSGWVSSTYNYQYGYVFYGTDKFRATCRGYTPDSATVRIGKTNGSSGCGLALSIATHNYASKPSTPLGVDPSSMPNSFTSGIITAGNYEDIALSSGARSSMGVDSGFGLVLFPGSTTKSSSCSTSTYRVTGAPGDTSYFTNPWRITYTFN